MCLHIYRLSPRLAPVTEAESLPRSSTSELASVMVAVLSKISPASTQHALLLHTYTAIRTPLHVNLTLAFLTTGLPCRSCYRSRICLSASRQSHPCFLNNGPSFSIVLPFAYLSFARAACIFAGTGATFYLLSILCSTSHTSRTSVRPQHGNISIYIAIHWRIARYFHHTVAPLARTSEELITLSLASFVKPQRVEPGVMGDCAGEDG